jgi:hypothetical protein
MSDQPKLSALAQRLLELYRADYRPGVGGKQRYRQVQGYSEADISAAYRELEQAGLLEQTGAVDSSGAEPQFHYTLTQKGKADSLSWARHQIAGTSNRG